MEQKTFEVEFSGKPYRCMYIKDMADAWHVIKQLMQKDVLFAIDTETEALPQYKSISSAALSPHLSKIRLLQVCDGKNSIIFDMKFIDKPEMFLEFLETKRFMAHYAVFDLSFFYMMGVEKMNIGCTMLLAKFLQHALYATDEGLGASLAVLTESLLKIKLPKDAQASDWSKSDLTFEQVKYAALDPIAVLHLAEAMAPGLKNLGLQRIYTLTKAAQHPIVKMQLNGLGLDIEAHRKLSAGWTNQMYRAKKEVLKFTGLEELTPMKLGGWLEKNLEPQILSIWPRTDTGKLSVDAHTFADFSHIPVAKLFEKYQKLETLSTSFGSKLIQNINQATGRVHAKYSLLGARTGRLSCSRPNLMQIPRDKNVRSNFIAGEGRTFLCADFSQIELRVAAEVSRDSVMLQAYKDGIDLHKLTASKILNKSIDNITKDERQLGKAFSFGLLFGLGAKKFGHYAKKAYDVEVSHAEAVASIEIFRDTYAGYRQWQMATSDAAAQSMKVWTPTGKLRALNRDNYYGASMNTPIQGGAAEVMLASLCRLYANLPDHCKLENCVHDEILVSISEDYNVPQAKQIIENSMTQGFLDIFPNACIRGLVECKSGKNWGEAK